MKIKKLIIKNYKNLNLELSNDSSVIALIGNNGSGKSNVLEALSIIFFNLYNRKEKDIPFNFQLEYIIGAANNKIKVEKINSSVKIYVDGNSRADCYSYLPKQITAIYSGEEDRLWKKCYEPIYKNFISNINKSDSSGLGEYQTLPKMLYINKFYWHISLVCLLLSESDDNQTFCKDILGIKKINTIKFEFQKTNYENYTDSRVKAFINTIDDKEEYTIEELRDRLDLFYSWDEVYKFLYIAFTPDRRKILENIIIKYNDDNLEIEDFSEGEKKMLLIKAALEFAGLEDSIFILDEPDAHIHLNNKVQIKKVFEKYDQNRQVILTTHSPTLTESLEEDSLFMLNAGNLVSEGKQKVMENISGEYWNKIQQNAFLSSKKPIILLVEGKHDKEHITNAYNSLKDDYRDLEFEIFKLNTETNIQPFLRGLYESDFESSKLYIGIYDREEKILKDFKNPKNFTPIEGKSFYKILESDKPNGNYFVTTLPEIDDKKCDCSIEMMFEYDKWEIAYQAAVTNSIGKTKNKSIKKYSEDLLNDAKNQLADNSKDFLREDFKNFRKLFDLIRDIRNLNKTNVSNQETTSPQNISKAKAEIETTPEGNNEVNVTTQDEDKYYEVYTKHRKTNATARLYKRNKIILEKGSIISKDVVKSLQWDLKNRNKLIDKNCSKSEDEIMLLNDMEFKSCSEALRFVIGSNGNGWDYWILKSNNKPINTIRKKI
jgi:Fe-S cluster assembly ATPase SufC